MSDADGPLSLSFGRLGQAAVVALVCQLLLTGITGAIAAQDAYTGPVPARFQTPEVRPGDRALYVVDGPGDSGPPSVDGHPLQTVQVQWENPTRSLASNGSYPWTIQLTMFLEFGDGSDPSTERGDPGKPAPEETRYDLSISVDYNVETWTSTGTAVETHTQEQLDLPDHTETDLRLSDRMRWIENLANPRTPCAFHLPFHGQPTNLTSPLTQAGDCGGPNGTMNATGVERKLDARTLRLQTTGGDAVQAWYSPQLPMPVAWEGSLGALGLPLDGEASLELAEYVRGPERLEKQPEESGPGPWVIPTTDWRPWGPAEHQLHNVSFPLSEAYQELRQRSDDVERFLDEHPDAYTARAWMYKDRDAADRPRTVWQIILTDGTTPLERYIGRSAPVEGPTDTVRLDPPSQVWTRQDAPIEAPEPAPRYPALEDRPARLPVVEGSVLAVAGEQGYAPWEHPRPGYYSFEVSCPTQSCDAPDAIVEVGGKPPTTDDAASASSPWSGNTTTTIAGLSPGGEIDYLRGNHRTSSPSTFQAASTSAPPAPGSGVGGDGWELPPVETAAGVSVFAVLAGLFYYFWPKLKVIGVGLYSRIGKDPEDVLENETRERIFDLVREEPGIHFREIKRRLETGTGSLEHHLEKLVRADMLTEHATEGYVCYFIAGSIGPRIKEVAEQLRSESARAIVEALRVDPGASATDLANAVGMSRPAVSYHLDHLVDAGVVDKRREGRSLALELTDLGREAVDRLNLS